MFAFTITFIFAPTDVCNDNSTSAPTKLCIRSYIVFVRSYFSLSSESRVAQSLLRQDGEGYCEADSAGLNDLEDMFGEVKPGAM